MNIPEAVTVAIPTSALTVLAPFALKWLQSRFSRRNGFTDVTPTDLPKRTRQSDDRMRAVLIETAERVESLHDALGKKSDTGGYVILEMFKSLAANMTEQTRILGEQTVLLRQIAGVPPKPDTRYRGSG